jgi:hypothetical protein
VKWVCVYGACCGCLLCGLGCLGVHVRTRVDAAAFHRPLNLLSPQFALTHYVCPHTHIHTPTHHRHIHRAAPAAHRLRAPLPTGEKRTLDHFDSVDLSVRIDMGGGRGKGGLHTCHVSPSGQMLLSGLAFLIHLSSSSPSFMFQSVCVCRLRWSGRRRAAGRAEAFRVSMLYCYVTNRRGREGGGLHMEIDMMTGMTFVHKWKSVSLALCLSRWCWTRSSCARAWRLEGMIGRSVYIQWLFGGSVKGDRPRFQVRRSLAQRQSRKMIKEKNVKGVPLCRGGRPCLLHESRLTHTPTPFVSSVHRPPRRLLV